MRAREFIVEYNRGKTLSTLKVDDLLSGLASDGSIDIPPRLVEPKKTLIRLTWGKQEPLSDGDKAEIATLILQSIEELDPTPNKQYTPWLARIYAKGYVSFENINRQNMLGFYDIAKKRRMIKPEHMDINRFKTYDDFEQTMVFIYDGFNELQDESKLEGAEATKLYSDNDLLIVKPENEAAACKYGRGTRWCTAATQGYNYFNSYNRDGPLFILIPKSPKYDGEKYQLHFQSNQYMNEEDSRVSLSFLIKRFPNSNLKEWFLENDKDLSNTVEFASDEVLQQILDSLKEEVEPIIHERVTEWELDDQYYREFLKDEGYVDEDGEVDWDRVEKDGKTYMEYDDETRRWYKTNYELISDITPSELRDMDIYLMNEYYDEEGHHIRYVPDLIAKYYKESENSTWNIREYGDFVLKLLSDKITISYSSTDNKYQAKLV